MLSEFPKKQASNGPVTFVTLKRFAVLFFLPFCCENSLISSRCLGKLVCTPLFSPKRGRTFGFETTHSKVQADREGSGDLNGDDGDGGKSHMPTFSPY